MKTKEEIEKFIYRFWFNYRYDNGFRLTGQLQYSDERDMLVKVYTQCQEDTEKEINSLKKIMIESSHQAMSLAEEKAKNKDKQYTKEDMIGFFDWSLGMEVVEMICNNKTKQEIFQAYINSLNKQD